MSMQVSLATESRRLAVMGPRRFRASPDPILFDPSLPAFHPRPEVSEDNLEGLEDKLDQVISTLGRPNIPAELQIPVESPAGSEGSSHRSIAQESVHSNREPPPAPPAPIDVHVVNSQVPIDVHVVNDQIVDLGFEDSPEATRVLKTTEILIDLGFLQASWTTEDDGCARSLRKWAHSFGKFPNQAPMRLI